MATYEEAGVNISEGDKASELAYNAAKSTFASRRGLVGEPMLLEGGFTGLMNMGDFYLVQNNDGVGTKSEVARRMGNFDNLGYDLLAMVADDAVCVGAEVISISNTIDTDKVNSAEIGAMMEGLKKACNEQKIVIPGGEIAEMGSMINGVTWNATCVGVLEKDKFIDGSKIEAGNVVIGLKSRGFRSNGFSLVRFVLKNEFGEKWHEEIFMSGQKWGDAVLIPSLIYHDFVLSLIGRYGEKRLHEINGIAHVTGGGIGNNLKRILKGKGLGAELHTLSAPHASMLKLQEIGQIEDKEAYKTWNMGLGMMLVTSMSESEKILNKIRAAGFQGQIIGSICENHGVRLTSAGYFSPGQILEY